MTLFAYDERFLEHNIPGHPECAERLTSIVSHLKKTDLWSQMIPVPIREAEEEELAYVHTSEHIQYIKRFCQQGGGWSHHLPLALKDYPTKSGPRRYVGEQQVVGWIDADTYALESSFEVARLAAGAALSVIELINQGQSKTAFCAVRPPGHHATRDQAMGFCLLNNVAIGARFIQKKGWGRQVLIVDWDVHHGNGTQDIFWEDPSVGYFSVHRFPFYPGTGQAIEKGAGPGFGTTFNVPIHVNTELETVLYLAETILKEAAEKIKPDWILISCGFDSYKEDPIGGLGFEVETYAELTRMVKRVANEFAKGRIVSVLEGGYNLEFLGKLAEVHVRELL